MLNEISTQSFLTHQAARSSSEKYKFIIMNVTCDSHIKWIFVLFKFKITPEST